jgi:hypothetical protein
MHGSNPPDGSLGPDPRDPSSARRLLLTVWTPRPGAFSARAVLDDGTLRDFDSPFELVRFLSSPVAPARLEQGLR